MGKVYKFPKRKYEVIDVSRLPKDEVLYLLESMMGYIEYFSEGGVWDASWDEDIKWIDELVETTLVPEFEDITWVI